VLVFNFLLFLLVLSLKKKKKIQFVGYLRAIE